MARRRLNKKVALLGSAILAVIALSTVLVIIVAVSGIITGIAVTQSSET